MEGYLGRLTHSAQEQQNRGSGSNTFAHGSGANRLKGVQHAEGSDFTVNEQNTNQQSNVADSGDNERLLGCFSCGCSFVPESNQQVGADSYQFPGHVQQQEVIGQHQGEHGRGEHGMNGKVPAKPRVALHVSQGVNLDHHRDKGN